MRAHGRTTCSSSGHGAASRTRRCISEPTAACPRRAHRLGATSTSTIAAGRTRALTAPHPITPTSPSCPSAWQPNPGRRSTYRRGKAVQTTGPTSMSGIDPQTKKFTEPPEQIKREIAALKADKTVPEAEKKDELSELEAALNTAKAIQFKENIALVLKYYDKLLPLMQEPGRG